MVTFESPWQGCAPSYEHAHAHAHAQRTHTTHIQPNGMSGHPACGRSDALWNKTLTRQGFAIGKLYAMKCASVGGQLRNRQAVSHGMRECWWGLSLPPVSAIRAPVHAFAIRTHGTIRAVQCRTAPAKRPCSTPERRHHRVAVMLAGPACYNVAMPSVRAQRAHRHTACHPPIGSRI